MPEGLEAEIYRRAASATVGRTIEAVVVDDLQLEAAAIRSSLPGAMVAAVGRHRKLVIVELDHGGDRSTLGLHFGMTGRLIVDGSAAIDQLEYASGRDDPAWDRLVVTCVDGGVLRVNDPRRWATFTMAPTPEHLGPDVLTLTRAELVVALGRRRRSLKATLLDQSIIAGFGNLCVDEVLWHASLDPGRAAGGLTGREVGRLWRTTTTELPAMLARGGSHTGTLSPEVRSQGGPCPRPRCRGVLVRLQVGGRTTVYCPTHQR